MDNILLFISGGEIVVVLVVILLLFGSKKIPELAQGLGKGMKEFKRATEDIKSEIRKETEVLDHIKEFKDDLTKKL
ncbi:MULTISPECIES: twin-arginine translocase TatA/TatE family subunit [Labilibaculum]|uniref:Sec-independent protein translocase protein TatA n=2 Tax=Labilibaculum TaxID=2060722 RepID=A0A7M4D392_9BACT|nr:MULTISPECIES: twin-arginine translocase TatA/TatE family subunit [Labilibaculum]MUP37121.1 twin-arginine translocase TatA/TatE family subunit [Labilibaculum euxinus]MVB06326.1 twin-arginine translocase TatA/TatE family subunit [Labilibaculum euxinus]PKQ66790.1 Sec-independent protein translocase TatA [Labilibaculum manganireducens]